MPSFNLVRGIEKVSDADLRALADAARGLGCDPNWLAAVIAFESNHTFSPSVKNPTSGATGLIQFMPKTAERLGTTTAALGKMSFQEQLPWVVKYLEPWAGRFKTLEDTYLAVFYPNAIGKPDSFVIGPAGSAVYKQNQGFDTTHKGYVTRADVCRTIQAVYHQGAVAGVREVPDEASPFGGSSRLPSRSA